MLFKTPKAWYKDSLTGDLMREFLLPLSVLYYGAHLWKQRKITPQKLSKPVICIGNVVVGGAGKTPVAIAIAELLKACGKKVAFITRGYGGSATSALRVDPATHTYQQVGDEPLLLARVAPTYVSPNRMEAGKKAIADGAEILLMDDGLQNNTIVKDVSFMVVDGAVGFGNKGIFPAGPLREPAHQAAKRVQAIIQIGKDQKRHLEKLMPKPPLIEASLNVDENWLRDYDYLKTKKLYAFAGIGRPQKFYDSLSALGFTIAAQKDYPDHFPYTETDIDMMYAAAQKIEAQLITTEKDFLRIPPASRKDVLAMPVRLQFKEEEKILDILKTYL